jgi:thiamine-phosphate pyrophosphorylase
MVTDRRRVAADQETHLTDRVAAAARAGVHLIQVRERDLEARSLTRLVARLIEAVRGTGARVLVNDRLDVALAAGAHGVHLRGDSLPAARARRVAPPPFIIGRSVHTREEALRAQDGGGLDYLVFGTVFTTESKPGLGAAGLDALADVVVATCLPVLAIGGVTHASLHLVQQAGAAGFAAIGLFSDCAVDQLQDSVHQASLLFDTSRGRSLTWLRK